MWGTSGGRIVKCYGSGGEGHVKSECPTANKKNKAVRMRVAKVLAYNEVLARVGTFTMPITLDTGATISLLLKETDCVISPD